jgi:hypothetical protein
VNSDMAPPWLNPPRRMRVEGMPLLISADMRLRRVVRERRMPGSSKEVDRLENVVYAGGCVSYGKGVEDETDALTHDVVPAWHAHAHVLL